MTLTKRFLMAGLLAGMTCAAVVPTGVADGRADGDAQVVRITASKFHFTPDHITLVKGQPVTLQLTSTDATHGFLLRALKIDAAIKPGTTTAITVTPQTPGTFKAICDHYCGLGHGGMKMTVEVRESSTDARTERLGSTPGQPAHRAKRGV